MGGPDSAVRTHPSPALHQILAPMGSVLSRDNMNAGF